MNRHATLALAMLGLGAALADAPALNLGRAIDDPFAKAFDRAPSIGRVRKLKIHRKSNKQAERRGKAKAIKKAKRRARK